MLYTFFWIIPRRLNFIFQRFGQVGVTQRNLPSDWLRLFSSQTFSGINTPAFSKLVILHTNPPMRMEQIECSETSVYKIQTTGNYPEEIIQHRNRCLYA